MALKITSLMFFFKYAIKALFSFIFVIFLFSYFYFCTAIFDIQAYPDSHR